MGGRALWAVWDCCPSYVPSQVLDCPHPAPRAVRVRNRKPDTEALFGFFLKHWDVIHTGSAESSKYSMTQAWRKLTPFQYKYFPRSKYSGSQKLLLHDLGPTKITSHQYALKKMYVCTCVITLHNILIYHGGLRELPTPKSAIPSCEKYILLQSSQVRSVNSTGVNRFCKYHHCEIRQVMSLFYWWGTRAESVSLHGNTQEEESKWSSKSLVQFTLQIHQKNQLKDFFILKEDSSSRRNLTELKQSTSTHLVNLS